jgi:hypothetical protein
MMKRFLVLIFLLLSSIAWAGSTTIIIGRAASKPEMSSTLRASGSGDSTQCRQYYSSTWYSPNSSENWARSYNDGTSPYLTGWIGTNTAETVQDLYAMENLPAGAATVVSVKLGVYDGGDSFGTSTIALGFKISGTEYWGTAQSLDSFATKEQTWTTSPATSSAWTVSEVNGLQAGYKFINTSAMWSAQQRFVMTVVYTE